MLLLSLEQNNVIFVHVQSFKVNLGDFKVMTKSDGICSTCWLSFSPLFLVVVVFSAFSDLILLIAICKECLFSK